MTKTTLTGGDKYCEMIYERIKSGYGVGKEVAQIVEESKKQGATEMLELISRYVSCISASNKEWYLYKWEEEQK